ncbi:SDR family NAD(P)-dependent oxidoreductase, partial [Desulfovibrio sulfodismutans]
PPGRDAAPGPLLLSAHSQGSLRRLAGMYAARLEEAAPDEQCAIVAQAALCRDHLNHRMVIEDAAVSGVIGALRLVAASEEAPVKDRRVVKGDILGGVIRTAFVYSGNGGNWAGMGKALFSADRHAARALDEVDAAMAPLLGWSPKELFLSKDAGWDAARIDVVQPLLFAIQVGLTQSLRARGVAPDMVFGHSIGEVAAAWACGALTMEQASRVVVERSRLQRESHGLGDMAVAQLGEKDAQALPEVVAGELEIAAVNSARYVTLTGSATALDSVRAALKKRRAVFRGLKLGHPFHSQAMEAIKDRLLAGLSGVQPEAGDVAFYSTVHGRECPGGNLGADYWWTNLRRPVRFRDAALAALDAGARIFIEIGPDALLQPFLKNCFLERSATTVYLPSIKRDTHDGQVVHTLWKQVHVHGGRVHLPAIFPYRPSFVDLPAYPFDREPCMAEATPECLDLFGAKPAAHPLLGRRVRRGLPVWENTLDTHLVPFLADHVVGSEVVLPGAAYLEMALAAALEAYGPGAVEMENVELRHPMTFIQGKGRVVRFSLSAEGGDFIIESRELLQPAGMVQHASGRIVPRLHKAFAPATLPPARGAEEDVAGLYAKAVDSGLHFGPAFRPMRQVWRDGDMAMARLALEPKAIFPGAILHPSLIDGAFQMLLSLVSWQDGSLETFIYLPIRVGRMQMLTPGVATHAVAEMAHQSKRALAASFQLFDAQGRELARLNDCRFARVRTRDSLQSQQHVYATAVVPSRHPLDVSASAVPAQAEVDALAAPGIDALARSEGSLRRRQEALPFFTALVLSQTMEALRSLAGRRREFTVAELARLGGVPEGMEPYLAYALHFLVQMDMATARGEHFRLAAEDLPPAAELWRTALAEFPEHVDELALLGQIGKDLGDILRGRLLAAPLLTLRPGSAMENLFSACPRHQDGHAAAAILLDAILSATPRGNGLRILEAEAGPGGLAQTLIPRLAPGVAEYVLADRDEHFVEQLSARFLASPNVQACVFAPDDPEASLPEAMAGGGFDLIFFGHALYRLTDVPQALIRLYDLLRPGGMIVVVDTPPHPVADLLFGLAPDWWREESRNGRPVSHLMDSAEWAHCLAAAGFLPPHRYLGGDDSDVLLLAARKAPTQAAQHIRPARKRWIFFEDTASAPEARIVSEALGAALRATGSEPVRVTSGPAFQGTPQDGFTLDPESREHWKKLFQAMGETGASLEIVHLAGFDIRQEPDPETLDDIQNRRVASAVALARGWRKAKIPAGLCLVTGGALPLPGQTSRPVPSQGALAGLGRVLINEMPGLSPRLVDLHADPDGGLPLDAAVREILCPVRDLVAPGQDDKEVAVNSQGRFCLRLAPLETAAMAVPAATQPPQAVTLEMTEQGRLDAATWRPAVPPRPGKGQVLIANRAAGVNYRDIMFTLGRIPEEALENGASGPTLGLECSGTVLAVGQDVTGMAPGDAVCCLSGRAYDSHVLAEATAVFPLPRGMTHTAAATIPVAHFTAWYALTHLARLAPGERVLIHGAAGGVGLAAIQIAILTGAEIFATAGSPQKRALLSGLGVPHVLDSRSLDFEERVRELTDGQGVDVVLNSISGEALQKSLGLLRPLGRFLELGKVDFYTNTPLRMRLLRNNISFFGIDVDQVMQVNPLLCRRLFLEMLEHFEKKGLWPLPHSVTPRAAIAEAFRRMQQSRHMGKLVVAIDELAAGVRPLPPAELGPLEANACYLVTGGLGGLGLAVCDRLAALGGKHLVVVGRSGAVADAQKAAVSRLEAAGVRMTVVKADVADADSLADALKAALSGLPPLRGVVHCAGVLRDATIANLTSADIRAVLRAKALGGYNLHRLTRDIPLDFFIMFSSATTVLGNPGQGNYVAANTMLENLAAYRRSLGLPAVTFGWGPISDVGMLTSRPEVLQSLKTLTGAQELRAETAMDHMAKYARHDQSSLHVFRVSFKKLSRLPYVASPMYRYVISEGSSEQAALEQVDIREVLRGLSPKDAVVHLATLLSQHFARILRVPVSKIRHDKPMGELGMDSLMYVELGLATEEAFGVDISSLSLDKTASILTLAEMIHRQFEQPAGSKEAQAEAVSRLLRDVHGVSISAGDARRLLEGEASHSRPN